MRAIVSDEIVKKYVDFWNFKNEGPLVGVSYESENYKSPESLGLVKPWMEGDAGWIFARAVSRANKIGDMSPVADALDIMENEILNNTCYAGAAYPIANMNTGAGCLAAFITGYENFYGDTVWFELEKPWDYEKILALPKDHATNFAKVSVEAVRMAAERFKGRALLTLLDLGGLADVLSSLRRTDGFLYDMIDKPDEVKKSLRVVHEIWKNYYYQLQKITGEANAGLCTSWTAILSDTPYYPSQCDACALISPEMFKEFIAPTLNDEFALFDKTIYHLDGSGEIAHLKMMCENPSLKVIQWVPEPTVGHADTSYIPLYKSIIEHGRKIIFDGFRGEFDELVNLMKILPGGAFFLHLWAENKNQAEEWLDRLQK